MTRIRAIAAALIASATLTAPALARRSAEPQTEQRVNPNAKAVAEFLKAVDQYVTMHRELERTLPELPPEATPDAVYKRQRALESLIQRKRGAAKQGDVFVSSVRPVIRRLLFGLPKGPDGVKLKQTLGEERPPGEAVRLRVNGRYPDTIPLSTVPPQVLETLPGLPEELEYRFIDSVLILLDAHAHTIVDYLTGAVPR
jgi:hypothetical protein